MFWAFIMNYYYLQFNKKIRQAKSMTHPNKTQDITFQNYT